MYMYVYYIPSYLRYVYVKLHYYMYLKVYTYFVHCLRVFTAFIALHIHRRLAHPVVSTTAQVHVDSHGV